MGTSVLTSMNEAVQNPRGLARPAATPRAVPLPQSAAAPVPLDIREPESVVRPTRFPVSAEQWRIVAQALGLSPRELQIVQGIFDGGTEGSLAGDFQISAHTVHSHLDRIYRKLHVPNRTGLVLRVFEEILISERMPTF
jgi:DNA-binding CsgD family transcriptional regulator